MILSRPVKLKHMAAALELAQAGAFPGMAYNRAEFMARHRQLMTAWATYLDRLRGGKGDQVQEDMTPCSLTSRLG